MSPESFKLKEQLGNPTLTFCEFAGTSHIIRETIIILVGSMKQTAHQAMEAPGPLTSSVSGAVSPLGADLGSAHQSLRCDLREDTGRETVPLLAWSWWLESWRLGLCVSPQPGAAGWGWGGHLQRRQSRGTVCSGRPRSGPVGWKAEEEERLRRPRAAFQSLALRWGHPFPAFSVPYPMRSPTGSL